MSKAKVPPKFRNLPPPAQPSKAQNAVRSLLDIMIDGREFASIADKKPQNLDLGTELVRSLTEISSIRKRPIVIYAGNMINNKIQGSTAIDHTDDLPFLEMISNVDKNADAVDIILVTPGGYAETVANFVNIIRNRFNKVGFILPYKAMSSGTIFCLSGDELIMDERAYIGPIDPQVFSKEGRLIPAQAILTLLGDIQSRGEQLLQQGQQPPWTDIQLLNNLDAKEIGNAYNASRFSIELVRNYLHDYKFKNWSTHRSTGKPVTPEEKIQRAEEIATQLCDHAIWKTHSRGISREMAHNICRLEITHPEQIPGLDRVIRRFWALMCWIFENTNISKMYVSENYSIFKSDIIQ